jgi:outer membrane lipoprotein-sorting protein
MRYTVTLITLILLWPAISVSAPSAQEILKKADEIRNPSKTYGMEVTVDSTDDEHFRFHISIGGKARSLIKTLKPKREVGKNYLMIDETMWAFIPNIGRSVRVSLNQKISGQASNGDISRMRWYGDYKPEIVAQNKKAWVLHLKALKKGLTYEQIKVWIDKQNYRPVKAEYLTGSGKPLKYVTFTGFQQIAGAVRPTKILIRNAHDKSKQSTLRIRKMWKTDIPSSHFTQNNLR